MSNEQEEEEEEPKQQLASDSKYSWASEIPTEETTIASVYDELADTYDDSTRSWGYQAPTVVGELLVKYVGVDNNSNNNKDPQAAKILDAGCGTGLTGLVWKQNGGFKNITGIDISQDSLENAKKTGAYTALQRHNLADVPLPFPDDSFTAVGCVGVLTYLPDAAPIYVDFCRVTRPGGWIIFSQRNDLLEQRNEMKVFEDMEKKQGLWKKIHQSEAQPYLPHHKDYADKIKVHYFVFQVV